MRIILLITWLSCIAGCASMNEAECRNADWRMIGLEDGMAGLSRAKIGDHRQACAKHNMTPDLDAYNNGHREGVISFCTEANGYKFGRSGGSYSGVCPEDLRDEFLLGFQQGKKLHKVEQELRELVSSIKRSETRIKAIQKELLEAEEQLISDESTEDARRSLLEEVKQLEKELEELEDSLENAQMLVPIKERQLEAMNRSNSY